MNQLKFEFISDADYINWSFEVFSPSVWDEKLKIPSNNKALKNGKIVANTLSEQGLPIDQIKKRVKQYLKLNVH